MKRWLPLIPLAVLGLLGLLFAGYALHHNPEVHPAALVGQPVPTVALPTLDGGDAAPLTASVQGPTMINVFASWCAPCAIEQPELMALKQHGVRIVGVAYKDEPANTRAFLHRLGDPFAAVLVDRSGDAGIEFGVSGVPETFLVGANGVIFAKHTGPMSAADAEALAARLKAGR
jgi:cytochrome c biogenesis protein CcmG/thiol:disulfide interchange protein DsbE